MVEAQYASLTTGYKLGYPKCDKPGDELWPGAQLLFNVLEMIFGIAFTFEVAMKMSANGALKFFKSGWNLMDLVIIGFWFLSMAGATAVSVNPTIIRLARLARLFRFLRLVKTVQMFDVLRLLLGSLQ